MTPTPSQADPGRFDLLIRGGTVIDPVQGIHGRRDVGIRGGRIAAVAEDLPTSAAVRTIDATGLLVTPGLIDLHAHVFFRVAPSSIEAGPLAALDDGPLAGDVAARLRGRSHE